jgi:hypothetical protein
VSKQVGSPFVTLGGLALERARRRLTSTILRCTAAAGTPPINSVGNFGGFMGPFLVGWIKSVTGNFENGIYALAGFMPLAAGLFAQAAIEHSKHEVPPTACIEVQADERCAVEFLPSVLAPDNAMHSDGRGGERRGDTAVCERRDVSHRQLGDHRDGMTGPLRQLH